MGTLGKDSATMKIVVFATLVVLAAAKLPGHRENTTPVAILYDDRSAPDNGFYSVNVETDNGIRTSETGEAGSAGQSNVQGSLSYVAPDGQVIELTFIADEFGYRPVGPPLPTPPPMPAHALKQIQEAERQRALQSQRL